MNFKITIKPDKAYLKEAYEEIISFKKLRKWEHVLGVLLFLGGLILWQADKNNSIGFIPYFFMGAGIYEVFKFYYLKYKYVNDHTKELKEEIKKLKKSILIFIDTVNFSLVSF